MVIVFFGTPQFAVPSLEQLIASRHRVRAVVTQPDRARGRGQRVRESPVKATALRHGIPVFQPERLREPAVAEALAAWKPDLGVVVAYGQLIPEALLRVPPHGMINVHASLLPRYRGAAPVHRAILDGQPETGVTIMQVAQTLDAGDMLASARRPLGADETSDVVERDLAQLGARLLLSVVDQIEAGTARAESQDDMLATYAPRLTKDEGRVDWSLPARYVHNRVRGLYPWPHAYSYLDGSRCILLKTRVLDEQRQGEPGEIVGVTGDAIHVATGHGGIIAIEEIQPEGKRPMATRDFLAGRAVRVGARFTNSAGG